MLFQLQQQPPSGAFSVELMASRLDALQSCFKPSTVPANHYSLSRGEGGWGGGGLGQAHYCLNTKHCKLNILWCHSGDKIHR